MIVLQLPDFVGIINRFLVYPLKRLFGKNHPIYLPKAGDTIVIKKHFFYQDISHTVTDEYPALYVEWEKINPQFIIYRGRTVLEYFPGQEYKILRVYGVDKIDMETLKTLKHIASYITESYCLELEPTELQPNRMNVGHQLDYLLLFKGGYIQEKRDYRDSKLKEIGI